MDISAAAEPQGFKVALVCGEQAHVKTVGVD